MIKLITYLLAFGYVGSFKKNPLASFPVQYLLHFYQYLNEWCKNPHWSFSCCLAVLLPLSDMQGELAGFVGTNVLNSQLQTGQVEMPAIASLNADGIDGGTESYGGSDRMNKRDVNGETKEYDDHKCQQGTQTVLFMQPVTPTMACDIKGDP